MITPIKTVGISTLLVLSITACSTNPVTGDREFNLVSEGQELQIGKQQYAPMRQAQGGDYVADAQLQAYVNSVGQKLAAVSDRKLPYEFHVINSSVPNAWALPGGKIAVNRGLLTELNSEAELAAVLGHEITHAAARHGAQAMTRGMLLQGAVIGTVVASQGKDYAQLAQLGANIGAQLISQKYGRDAERESDLYGMQYMSRAGYNPDGAVELQKTFVRLSEGRNQDWLSGLFASHPPSRERVDNNLKTAAGLPKSGTDGSSRFQAKVARLKQAAPAYEAYDEARKALAGNDLSGARRLAQRAVQLEPREGHFYALLGDIEQAQKRPAAARAQYDKAISLNRDFFYYHLQRGLANLDLKDARAASRDLEASTRLLPTADAYYGLGLLAKASGNGSKAKQYFSQAAGSDSSTGKAAFGELMALDLPGNPGAYIKVAAAQDGNGNIIAKLSNPTPRDVSNIVVSVAYPNAAGRMIRVNRTITGTLKAGSSDQLNLQLGKLSTSQLQKFKIAVTAASLH